ncbi:ClpXP protease specificity-enhancing factor / Stringent starvation protein B [plant metagenome]|uniref:ClpXP protease specificity-enhancing factor / Stringent starvation protein B n=1 Tax=plant metagenome TaxID=1297885 RepID=A0A484UEV3_9ZZZZ
MGETSTKPYLIRALHEWCTDNGYTPYVVVKTDARTRVPLAHVQDGQITLNIGTLATNQLTLGNEFIEFQARFGGVTEHVSVPIYAVSAIYARETGAGMGFEVDPPADDELPEGLAPDQAGDTSAVQSVPADPAAPDTDDDPSGPDDEPKRPRLTIVK